MSAHARKIGTGTRRVTGDALLAPGSVQRVKVLLAPGSVQRVKVRCACEWTSDEEIALDEPLKRQLAEMSCGSCGRLGRMSVVR